MEGTDACRVGRNSVRTCDTKDCLMMFLLNLSLDDLFGISSSQIVGVEVRSYKS